MPLPHPRNLEPPSKLALQKSTAAPTSKNAPTPPRTSPAASTSPPATNSATNFPLQRGIPPTCATSPPSPYPPPRQQRPPVSTPGDSTHRSRHRHRGRHHYRDRLGRNYGFESGLCCARGALAAVSFGQRSPCCEGRGGQRGADICGSVFVSGEGTVGEARRRQAGYGYLGGTAAFRRVGSPKEIFTDHARELGRGGRMGLGVDEGLGIGCIGVMYVGGEGKRVGVFLSRLSAEERHREFIGLMAAASLGYLHRERCTALEGFMRL